MLRNILVGAVLTGCHAVPYDVSGVDDPGADGTVDGRTEPSDPPKDPSDPPADVDSDGDGLTDAEEIALGTDPDAADSDGDGWDDRVEVDGNTDPTDHWDHPYTGGWPIDACRHDIQSTGNRVGDVADDFTLSDQNGEQVSLHDFCGQAVLLVSSAQWCGPCQAEATELQALYTEYRTDGFLVITLLGENNFGGSPSRSDLQSWADSFGLRHPVLSDPGFGVTSRFVTGGTIYLPTEHLIGPGAEVIARDTYVSEGQVQNALP